jgi:hypothetical protein
MHYNMKTENLSRTGLLISKGNYKAVPFSVNTLLEMTIDPDCKVFEEPVRCLGKVVRRDHSSVGNFGVQIIQIEGRDARDWELNMSRLESGDPSLLEAG